MTPGETIKAAGIEYRPDGSRLRIAASWAGRSDFSVSVRSDTGAWIDHASRESGKWAALAKNLGIDGSSATCSASYDPEEESKIRVSRALAIWNNATPIGAQTVMSHGLWQKIRMREAQDWVVSYLDDRKTMRAAIEAKARWSIIPNGAGSKGAPCIVWPIRNLMTGQIIGVQREWGRGHDNKRMAGKHKSTRTESGGFILRGNDKVILIAEGMHTAASVWLSTGCTTLCLYDTGGIKSPPLSAIKAGSGAVKGVIVAADNDPSGAGIEAARVCVRKHRAARIKACLSAPVEAGVDWADVLVMDGADGVRAMLKQRIVY